MKKALLLTGMALCMTMPAMALKQGEITASGWYRIKCTGCTNGNNGLVGKYLINADVPRRQNNTNSYSIRVLDSESDVNRPASAFIYVRAENGTYAYRSSNGHWIDYQTKDCLEPSTANMVQHGYDKEIGDWAVYGSGNEIFVGGSYQAHNEFDITPADTEAYDVWTVTINIPSLVTPPSDRPYIEFTGEANKGCYRVFNGGTYFVAKGATVAPSDITIPEGSEILIDPQAYTITVSETHETMVNRVVNNAAPVLALDADAATAYKAELVNDIESITDYFEALAAVAAKVNSRIMADNLVSLDGHHSYYCGLDNVHNHATRFTPAVRMSDNVGTPVLDLTTTQSSAAATGRQIFHDLSDAAGQFSTVAGATVTLAPQNTPNVSGVHKKLYIDWDHSGNFDYKDAAEANKGWFNDDKSLKTGTDIELVSFDRCGYINADGSRSWVLPNGMTAGDNGLGNIGAAMSFTIPADAEPGEYYGRYLISWDTYDPAGNPDGVIDPATGDISVANSMKNLGSVIIDFKLNIRLTPEAELRAAASKHAREWIAKLANLEMFRTDGSTPSETDILREVDINHMTLPEITAAVDMVVSNKIAAKLDGRFITIKNYRSGWYLHSNCGKVTLKNDRYARSLWRVFAAETGKPFTYYIRSVYNTGWMLYDERGAAGKQFFLTPDEEERTAITLHPFEPGTVRDHFYICGPNASTASTLSQGQITVGGAVDPFNETMVTGVDDEGSVWVINYVKDDEVKERHLEKYLSRFADSEDDTESLNKIRPTAEITAARAALETDFSVDKLIELLKLPDNGLNQPVPGRYYRLALSDVNKLQNGITSGDYYVSSLPATVNNKPAAQGVALDGHEAETIFYLVNDGEANRMVAYNGYYVKGGAAQFFHVAANLATNTGAPTVQFPRAGSRGINPISSLEQNAYNIVLDDIRYAHMAVAVDGAGNYADGAIVTNACSSACGANHNFYIEPVDELPVTVGADLCAAVYFPVAVTAPEGCVVYTAAITGEGGNLLSLTETDGRLIPANTPAVIRAVAAGTLMLAVDYNAPAATPAADAVISGSYLVTAADAAANIFVKSASAVADATVLPAGLEADGYAMFEQASAVLPANTMYFPVADAAVTEPVAVPLNAASAAQKSCLNLADGTIVADEETGISAIEVNRADGTSVIYDLQGRRLTRAAKGVNIIDGRKVIVK